MDRPSAFLASRLWGAVIAPVKAGALVAVGYALVAYVRRRRERVTLAIFAGGAAWFALVAAMTEAGFAGNYRYLIVTTAAGCVLGGIGAARVLQGVDALGRRLFGSARAGALAGATALALGLAGSLPFIFEKGDNIDRVLGGLRHEAAIWHDLKGLIDDAGGRERLLACGGIFSGPFQIQMLAYELHIHGVQIGWKQTPPPGVLFRTRTVPNGSLVVKPTDPRFRQVMRHGKWRLLTVPPEGARAGGCPATGPDAPRAPAPPRA